MTLFEKFKNLTGISIKDFYTDVLDFYENYPEEVKTFKGYYILAIDGSMFEIPNTAELREKFKTQKNNSGHRESARARVSGIYDIENEFMDRV